jgi:branched-chain amino acid transport system ATP-binding protein
MIDEMSLGLAPAVVDDLLALLPELAAAGTAVLLVEQDVEAALSVAARGYVLELGAVVREGRGAELLADPRLREAYLGAEG